MALQLSTLPTVIGCVSKEETTLDPSFTVTWPSRHLSIVARIAGFWDVRTGDSAETLLFGISDETPTNLHLSLQVFY